MHRPIRRFVIAITMLIGMVIAAPVAAYWALGHETIARIADANIAPSTRVQVRRILSHADLLATPECPASTIVEASTWADCIKPLKDSRGKARFGYAYGWHFQDVEICRPFDLASACRHGNCVSAQIERDVAVLRSRGASLTARVTALAFLIHFVGDLHQPLHAGEKDDRGGNDVAASYGPFSPPHLNLHAVWDGYLPERAISAGPSLVRRYPAAERTAVVRGSVADWSRESWQVAHDVTYAGARHGDPCAPTPRLVTLDEATVSATLPVVRLEIERAGLRLARLLDAALATPGSG